MTELPVDEVELSLPYRNSCFAAFFSIGLFNCIALEGDWASTSSSTYRLEFVPGVDGVGLASRVFFCFFGKHFLALPNELTILDGYIILSSNAVIKMVSFPFPWTNYKPESSAKVNKYKWPEYATYNLTNILDGDHAYLIFKYHAALISVLNLDIPSVEFGNLLSNSTPTVQEGSHITIRHECLVCMVRQMNHFPISRTTLLSTYCRIQTCI